MFLRQQRNGSNTRAKSLLASLNTTFWPKLVLIHQIKNQISGGDIMNIIEDEGLFKSSKANLLPELSEQSAYEATKVQGAAATIRGLAFIAFGFTLAAFVASMVMH